jgi:hypothetical protein
MYVFNTIIEEGRGEEKTTKKKRSIEPSAGSTDGVLGFSGRGHFLTQGLRRPANDNDGNGC